LLDARHQLAIQRQSPLDLRCYLRTCNRGSFRADDVGDRCKRRAQVRKGATHRVLRPIGDRGEALADDGVEATHPAAQRIRQLRRSGVRPLPGQCQLGQEHRLSVRRRALQPLARCSAEPRGPVSAQLERRFVRELLRRREIARGSQPQALSLPGDDGLVIVPSDFTPRGDQPQAIVELIAGLERQERDQVLLGVTGSGKTFTMAHVIQHLQRPTLILAPNKTLAAQLYGEMKSFFPENAVEYFVSYYDYYQPEAYVPRTDTYIEKESSINEQIDRMRHSATRALFERRDVIIVASVSCIYGIGSPETYSTMTETLTVGREVDRQKLLRRLIELHYKRNDANFQRGSFRIRGDSLEIFPAHMEDRAWKLSLFGDEIE